MSITHALIAVLFVNVAVAGCSSSGGGSSLNVSSAQSGLDAVAAMPGDHLPTCSLGDPKALVSAAHASAYLPSPYPATHAGVERSKSESSLTNAITAADPGGYMTPSRAVSCEVDGPGQTPNYLALTAFQSLTTDELQVIGSQSSSGQSLRGPFAFKAGKVYGLCSNSDSPDCTAGWFPSAEGFGIVAQCSWKGVTVTACRDALTGAVPLVVSDLARHAP